MKINVLVRKTSLRLLLVWTQRILITTGVLMLGFCGFVLIDTRSFQNRESRQLERLVDEQRADRAARQVNSLSVLEASAVVAPDGLIGRIEIPRLGLSAVVMEGTSNSTLRRSVGHIAGTALPGQQGNVGIAGHRDRFFRPLRNIQQNDMIKLTTLGSEYRYRVVSTKVVKADDVAVLASDGKEVLTLVTCYPFYFVGAAPDRFIVRAERVEG